jgi:hypothetical protein
LAAEAFFALDGSVTAAVAEEATAEEEMGVVEVMAGLAPAIGNIPSNETALSSEFQ